MSEVEALFLTDTGFFMSCLFSAIWLIALVGTIYELRRWYRNRTAYKPCEHLFASHMSNLSKEICFNCGDIK